MINFSIEPPPQDLAPEVREYLDRQLNLIREAVTSTNDFEPTSTVPDKIQDGALRYVDTTNATFTSKGFWSYVDGAWVKSVDSNDLDLSNDVFPSSTVMYFGQASAPTGWTQTASNDRMLRVVSGTGAGTGGTDSPIASHTHTTASHTLTTAEMPYHTHQVNTQTWMNSAGSNYVTPVGTGYYLNVTTTGRASTYYNGYTGSSNSHSHGNTGSSFSPKYTDIIECTKD